MEKSLRKQNKDNREHPAASHPKRQDHRSRMLSVPRRNPKDPGKQNPLAQQPPARVAPNNKHPAKDRGKALCFYEGISLKEYLSRGPQAKQLFTERDQLFFDEQEELQLQKEEQTEETRLAERQSSRQQSRGGDLHLPELRGCTRGGGRADAKRVAGPQSMRHNTYSLAWRPQPLHQQC